MRFICLLLVATKHEYIIRNNKTAKENCKKVLDINPMNALTK